MLCVRLGSVVRAFLIIRMARLCVHHHLSPGVGHVVRVYCSHTHPPPCAQFIDEVISEFTGERGLVTPRDLTANSYYLFIAVSIAMSMNVS